jgi:hypothetical protein
LVDLISEEPTAALPALSQRPGMSVPRAPQLEFSEAWEIYRSDVALVAGDDLPASPPAIIVTMSFNRLFLGGLLSSRARLRFTGWEYSALNRLDKAVIVIDGMTVAKG